MAYASRNTALVEGLILSVTGRSKDATGHKQLRDIASRGLKDQSAARTNQFDVWSKLDGLVEKFGVLNREDLADALQCRLDELPKEGSKWQPETLSLLLLLSDRPTDKTNLSDLHHHPEQADTTRLTYSDILGHDPLNEPGLWEDIERGYHSSGDDDFIDGVSEPTASTRATSVTDDDLATIARSFVQPVKEASAELSSGIHLSSHIPGTSHDHHTVSELCAIRETLLMIRGLPTSLYSGDQSTGFGFDHNARLATAAYSTTLHTLIECADLANSLLPLRLWLRAAPTETYVETMQCSMAKVSNQFDLSVARYETRYITPEEDSVVSMVGMLDDLRKLSRPLVSVSRAVQSYGSKEFGDPFSLIDGLYEEACTAQLAGDDENFRVLASLVWCGLTTYLKDLDIWIEHGETPPSNNAFFVYEADAECKLADLYHGRFAIRLLPDSRPSAPRVLSTFIEKAFAMGKSRAFISALPFQVERTTSHQPVRKLASCASLLSDLEQFPFLPFPQLVRQALDGWFGSSSQDSTFALDGQLLKCDKGLFAMLDIFELACCSRDGILFEAFADGLFARINDSRSSWKDDYMLKERARETLGSHPCVDATALRIHTHGSTTISSGSKPSCRDVEDVQLLVSIPWYVQNVTREATPESHAKTFVFLLQLYRAKSVLRTALFVQRRALGQPADLRLRQSLIWLVDTVTSHCTVAVQTLGRDVRDGLTAAVGIDAMVAIYASYRKKLDVNLLIGTNYKPIRETVTELLDLCACYGSHQGTIGAQHYDSGAMDNASNDIEPGSLHPATFTKQSTEVMQRQYARLLDFLVAGLRGISRASGEKMLEELAEKLEWGLGPLG